MESAEQRHEAEHGRGWTTFLAGLPEYKQQVSTAPDAKYTALMLSRERNNNAEFSAFDVVEVEAGETEKHEGRLATGYAPGPAASSGAAQTPADKLWALFSPQVLKVLIVVLTSAVVIGLVAILIIVGINVSAYLAKPYVTEPPATNTTSVTWTTTSIATPSESSPVSTTDTSPTSLSTAAVPSSSETTSSSPSTPSSSPSTPSSASSPTPTTTSSTASTPSSTLTTSTTTALPTTTSTTTSTTTTTATTTTAATTTTTTAATTTTTTTAATTTTTTAATTTTSASTTTPTPTTTATFADCNEFRCTSGECLPWKYLCDGLPHCKDGSDEGKECVCGTDQWQCKSGQCVPASARCNQRYDCEDSSDEVLCSDCSGFQCDNGMCLWDGSYGRCNGVFECSDFSDEMGCPYRPGTVECQNSVRILRSQWCDGVDHCGDNSDEKNCRGACRTGRVACLDGTCIMSSWVCDGFNDCVNGTDEQNCPVCTAGKFTCANYRCFELSAVCDGFRNCRTGEDEQKCFSIKTDESQLLIVNYTGQNYAVCSDVWSTRIAEQMCDDIGQQHLSVWDEIKPPGWIKGFVALKDPTAGPVTSNLEIRESCSTGSVISISCQKEECGERQVSFLQSFVAGGQIAAPGKWPWVASLLYLGQVLCGATLINSLWLVTAAHCITNAASRDYDLTKTPFYFDVILGSTHKLGQSADGTPYRIRVSKILLSPNVNVSVYGTVDWDVALVKLSVPVMFTDYIQPACLPHSLQATPDGSICYLAGWGFTNAGQVAVSVDLLRDTRLQVWSDARCARNTVPTETAVNLNSTICAGYFGVPSGCQGDSGGPLMCLSSSQRWVLAGVMSRGSTPCGQYTPLLMANRFARVSTSVNWIRQQIGER